MMALPLTICLFTFGAGAPTTFTLHRRGSQQRNRAARQHGPRRGFADDPATADTGCGVPVVPVWLGLLGRTARRRQVPEVTGSAGFSEVGDTGLEPVTSRV